MQSLALKNDVEYNPTKSLCMVFKPRGFNLKCPYMYMNLNKLAYVKEAKYLGVIICNDLKDDGDILRHLRNCYARSNSIIRTFNHCSVGVKTTSVSCVLLYNLLLPIMG